MPTQSSTPRPQWWSDMALVLALTLIYFWLATQGDWSEKFSRFAQLNEAWQLDELPLTLLMLSLGLFWFSWRRMWEFRQELAQRMRADTRVHELAERNKDLSQQLMRAQESERQALARELHDEFGQHCTAIRAEAQYIQNTASCTDQAADRERVALSARHINSSAEILYGLVRNMLTRLRPPTLDSLGLEFALQELCESWEEKTDVAVVFSARSLPEEISDEIGIAGYRLVQEALTNVARHAQATQVRVDLWGSEQGTLLLLRVTDNGRSVAADAPIRLGFGLCGMRERIEALHGQLVLGPSSDASGWTIEASVPSGRGTGQGAA